MGLCNNCVFYTKSGTSMLDAMRSSVSGLNGCNDIGFCMLMTDAYGNRKKVRGLDTCNNFKEKASTSNSGYSSHDGCYLTSACVGYMGKSDDCEELTVLRAFRDEYMRPNPEYAPLIEEYYRIAPQIVDKINSSDKQEEIYKFIYGKIQCCIALIRLGDSDSAVKEYSHMTLELKNNLCVS